MASEMLTTELEYAARYPNRRVVVRDPEWSHQTLHDQYMMSWAAASGQGASASAAGKLISSVVVLKQDRDVFLETNSHGFFGPEIDFSKKLVAIWGDSVVEGWGHGWIGGLSEHFPGFQMLNGGINAATFPQVGTRALEMNRRVPIAYNVIFPGLNTMRLPIPSSRTVYAWLHRLCTALPNVILCTQPTSLNEDLAAGDITPHLAKAGSLGYRAGYNFWNDAPPTQENVRAFFEMIQEQNRLVWQVVSEQASLYRRRIPVVDFYKRFYTRGLPEFRDYFVDAGHFRGEAYPIIQEIFHEAFSRLLR